MNLRIGQWLISTNVNGPGRRLVIWLQGCPLCCKNCLNPEFFDQEGGMLVDIDEIMSIIEASGTIEGVTFTGGEPLIQAKALLPLAAAIRSKGLTIVCYTGYLLQDILQEKIPYAKDLLSLIDILIDGPYIEEEKAILPWRGSRNQKIYFITDRYKHLESAVAREGVSEVEIQIDKDHIHMTGLFDIKLWEELKKEVNK